METAQIVHQIRGRARLRLPARRHDALYFHGLRDSLARIEGVTGVVVNPLVASVLLLHRGELAEVLQHAEKRDLFCVMPAARSDAGDPETPGPDPSRGRARSAEMPRAALDKLGRVLRRATPDTLEPDAATLGFLVLAGLGALQATRGRALPAGVTLLHYAIDLLRTTPRR